MVLILDIVGGIHIIQWILVINLRQEYCLNVSTWDPVEHSEDVPLEILRDMHEPSKEMIAEYKEKCSDIVHSVSTSYKSGYVSIRF